jgi:hypothetical protein
MISVFCEAALKSRRSVVRKTSNKILAGEPETEKDAGAKLSSPFRSCITLVEAAAPATTKKDLFK